MSQKDFLYRYEDRLYSNGYDEDGYSCGSTVEVHLVKFRVLSETLKGAWIEYWNTKGKRFVNLSCRKKFACVTIEEAKESFIRRKYRQISILKAQLRHAESALNKINKVEFSFEYP